MAQLLIWMLDATVPKDHWQRPVHWKYAEYSDDIPDELEMSIRAFTAACSNPVTSPANGKEAAELLEKLFPRQFPSAAGEIDPNVIIKAKQRGETIKRLGEGAVQEEVESSAPLAEKIYVELRETVLCVLKEVSKVESSARVLFDHPFRYQTIGATDLLSVCVGPQKQNIQLRIKAKIIPWSATHPSNESNRAFWQKHLSDGAICFTFALEGGVVQAYDTRYLEGRWLTIHRDGSVCLHPLKAGFGNFQNNDLGGSAEGPGVASSMTDVRDFVISVLTNQKYWTYIAQD